MTLEEQLAEKKKAGRKRMGFGSMSRERQREIASMGGKTAHALGKAHEFTSESAKVAGRKGGLAVCGDREYMSEIGKRGARKRHEKTEPHGS